LSKKREKQAFMIINYCQTLSDLSVGYCPTLETGNEKLFENGKNK
jgi:hypothetical protein